MVALKVHHRQQKVHDALTQPALRILVNGAVCRPSACRVSVQIFVFTYWRTADAHPGLNVLDGFVSVSNHSRDVVESPLTLALPLAVLLVRGSIGERFRILRVAYIVEMYAINIVVTYYLLAYGCQIVCRARKPRVKIVLFTMLSQ